MKWTRFYTLKMEIITNVSYNRTCNYHYLSLNYHYNLMFVMQKIFVFIYENVNRNMTYTFKSQKIEIFKTVREEGKILTTTIIKIYLCH